MGGGTMYREVVRMEFMGGGGGRAHGISRWGTMYREVVRMEFQGRDCREGGGGALFGTKDSTSSIL